MKSDLNVPALVPTPSDPPSELKETESYLMRWVPCPACHGHKVLRGTKRCPECEGKGKRRERGALVYCQACNLRGWLDEPCETCRGTGKVPLLPGQEPPRVERWRVWLEDDVGRLSFPVVARIRIHGKLKQPLVPNGGAVPLRDPIGRVELKGERMGDDDER